MKKLQNLFYTILIFSFCFSFVSCSNPDFCARIFQEICINKYNHTINSYTPKRTPYNGPLDGRYVNFQVKYGTQYPNSYMDIYYAKPSVEESKDLPVVVYIHGGCFWWGDSHTGNPTDPEGLSRIIKAFNDEGFNVVSIDYALTPDYIFPTQLIQINQMFQYIKDNTSTLKLKTDSFFICGGSAGAVLTSQYTTLVTNENYRNLINFGTTALNPNDIKGLCIEDGFWDWVHMTDPIKSCAGNYMNRTAYISKKMATKYDIVPLINENFPPACVVSGIFTYDAQRLYNTIYSKNGNAIYIDGKGARGEKKIHCYMVKQVHLGDANVDADFNRVINFFNNILTTTP